MVFRWQARMTAVAVVVEVAGIAGGASAAEEFAQVVVGVVAALVAEHGAVGRQRAYREVGLEPPSGGIPNGVAGAHRRRAARQQRRYRRGTGG